MKLWVLPFSFGIIAILSGNLAFFISFNEGFIDPCFPYIEGCVSISRSGRHGLAAILFKLSVLPVMTLLFIYWVITYRSIKKLIYKNSIRNNAMLITGIIGSLFGILYTAFLGSEGDFYQLLRRVGIYFFFLGTYAAQILEVIQLSPIFVSKGSSFFKGMRFLIVLIGLIILISTPFYGFLENDDWLENVLEWNLTFLIFFYFILSGLLWRETALRMNLEFDHTESVKSD